MVRIDKKNDTENLPTEEMKTHCQLQQHWGIISCLSLEFTAIKYIVDELKHYNGKWCVLRIYICAIITVIVRYSCWCCLCFGVSLYISCFISLSVLSIVIWQHYHRHHLFEWRKPRNKSGWAHCYFWMFQINGIRIYFFKCEMCCIYRTP